MVYNMETNEKIDLLNLAKKYAELFNKEKDNFPYRLNVINELHDDENAHSRILIRLLQYKDKDEYTWLKFFVNRMKNICEEDININVSNPKIETEHNTGNGRIDGLIWEEGKYAIIIENKIWNASDQENQIGRYVEYVTNKVESIYVIYLTLDGGKIISEYSLSDETRKILGNRFIPMNFQDDIILWLEEDVLPNCKVKEKCLGSAVYQYIDYLKERLGQLDYQRQAQKNALKQILNDMNIAVDYKDLKNKYNDVQLLASALGNEVNELGKKVADEFQNLTKKCFEYMTDFDFCDNNRIKLDGGYYQVYNEQWVKINNLNPHLEWCPISYSDLFESKNLTFVFHIEGKMKEKCAEILKAKAECENIDYLQKYTSNTYYKKEYSLEKPFASMTDEERRQFLQGVYSSEEVKKIIELMNGTIAEMNNQN